MRFWISVLLASTVASALRLDVSPRPWPQRPLPHVWTSTGFSPEARDGQWSWPLKLTEDERTGLALIGSLRGDTFTHVRIHWLLDFITARPVPGQQHHLAFNFSALDDTVALLRRYRLWPGFELMGNPSGVFGDPIAKNQRRRLRALLLEMTQRYPHEDMRQWRWETWNEPDLKMYLNSSLPSFLAYFHATVDALRDAGLRVGGPAGLLKPHHTLCWGLLEEAARHATPPLAFVSFHQKGNSSADDVIRATRQTIKDIRTRFPALAQIPMANDEADPLSGWWRSCDWRSDARYAAMVARSASHLVDDVAFLSNDNAFLPRGPNFFSQRTLLARFPEADHAHFFVKPVATTLALMSLLGDHRLPLTLNDTDDRISVLAGAWTRNDGLYEASTLITFGSGVFEDPQQLLTLDFHLHCDVGCRDARFAIFLVDNVRTNPSQVWAAAGRPEVPDAALRQRMRDAQGPFRAVVSAPLVASVAVALRLPSVALVQVCARGDDAPGAPTQLHGLRTAPGELLLLWSDQNIGTRCLIGYEVQGRRGVDSDWETLAHGSILTHWHDSQISSAYRVSAVDLWGRRGPYSDTLLSSETL